MNFFHIFIATVPSLIIYIYQFMVLFRKAPVVKVFIAKVFVCLQPVILSRIVIRLNNSAGNYSINNNKKITK